MHRIYMYDENEGTRRNKSKKKKYKEKKSTNPAQ